MPDGITWGDELPPGWRERNRLIEAWHAHYMSLGVARFRAYEIAKKKAAKGNRPPLRVVQ